MNRIASSGLVYRAMTCLAALSGAVQAEQTPSAGERETFPLLPYNQAWTNKTHAILFGPRVVSSAEPAPEGGEPAAAPREGGETCFDAVVINALPFDDTGDTRNNTHEYESPNCNDDVNESNDVVYKYTPFVSQVVRVSCCNTDTTQNGGHQDTRLWIYESMTGNPNDCVGGNEIACNDDDANQCLPQVTAPRTSEIEAVEMIAGRTYYIIADGWNGENGIYAINVRPVEPGTCCTNAGGPNSCVDGVTPLQCNCLTAKFTEGAQVCLETDCYTDPVPAAGTCPPTHVFGPGFNTGAVSFFVIASDDTFGTSHTDAYWDTAEPLKFYTWSGVYSLLPDEPGDPALNGACDKPSEFTVSFYADDCGTPGELIAGPFEVTGIRDGTGFAFAGTSQIFNFTAQLPVNVSVATAWVGVAAKADPNNPNCVFRTMGYGDEGAATGQTGDLKSVILGPGAPFPFSIGGDMAMCVSAPSEPGACCDDTKGTCANNQMPDQCPPPARFVEQTTCPELAPPPATDVPCGQGACCKVDGTCELLNQGGCTAAGGDWKPGTPCAFANCPPSNDNCALVPPATGGPPYSFANRTNGATDDDCPGLGVAAGWEAFTLAQACSDLIVDYCGTGPAFVGNAADFLLEGCCELPALLHATTGSTTARIGACCRDEPPGYDPNLALEFRGVPAGTWYYPVFSGGGSLGDYVLNVTGGPVAPEHHSDADGNNRVDLSDHAVLAGCMSGPATPFASMDCACLTDHDADGDVDLKDYWRLQQQRTGCTSCSGTAEAEPGCAGGNDTCATADVISCGTTVCGSAGTGDIDYYRVGVGATTTLSWTVTAEFPVSISIRDINLGCDGAVLASAAGGACGTTSVSACVRPGTYVVTVQGQDGETIPCPSAYRGVVACLGACTPPTGGACCRANQSCTPNTARATCEAAEGKYQGDGTSCPCPTPPAGDECLTAVALTGASGTRTIDRAAITSAANDPVSNCETEGGGPFAKDGSTWFTWTAPAIGVARLQLDLCCQGGAAGAADTLISVFPENASCATIVAAGNGAEMGCDDDSCAVGTGGSVLCFDATNGATYRIMVEIYDSGTTDEQGTLTLTYTSGGANCAARTCPVCGTAVPCPGGSIAENEQTQAGYCGLDYQDHYNSGCNAVTVLGDPEPAFAVEIACGDEVCGSAGYYNTTGGDPSDRRRDTDWYLLNLTEETLVNWEVESQTEGAHALLINVEDCANTIIIASTADLDAGNEPAPGCGPAAISEIVPAGRYAVFASFIHPRESAQDPGESINCPTNYVGRLGCERAGGILATPADACGAAPVLTGAGRYTGIFGPPLSVTADGESTCDGVLNNPNPCVAGPSDPDLYWKYQAPCTGKVAFEVRRGHVIPGEPPVPVKYVLSAHSACPADCSTELPGGLGFSCSDFGGGPGGNLPRILLDVEAGQTYVIRLAAGAAGPYELLVSDCTVECAPRCGDGTQDPGEECDDGNLMSGDGCDAFCQTE